MKQSVVLVLVRWVCSFVDLIAHIQITLMTNVFSMLQESMSVERVPQPTISFLFRTPSSMSKDYSCYKLFPNNDNLFLIWPIISLASLRQLNQLMQEPNDEMHLRPCGLGDNQAILAMQGASSITPVNA